MLAGNVFGRFTAFGKIGVGGMGTVYAAFDHDSLDIIAIKTLISDYNDDEMAVSRFKREAALYSQIQHPNIVTYIEAGMEGDSHYIGLEYVRGKSLADIIDYHREKVLTLDRIINIVIDVARALEKVHELGILHRDIKPSNIILTQDDTVKLLDFGIALAEDGMELTATGMVVGTFVYSSPEQNQGRILDERSDLYSLGCVFFEMLTGQRALPCNSMTEVARFQALPNLASPSNFNPKVPGVVDEIVAKLLKPRARDRYDSATDLIEDLVALKQSGMTDDDEHVLFGDELSNIWEDAKRTFFCRDYDKALEIANSYVKERPGDARAHFLLGKIYALKTLPFNSTEAFALAIEKDKENLDYRLDFALALYRLEMYHQCIQTCEEVLEQDEDNVLFKGVHMLSTHQYNTEKKEEAAVAQVSNHALPIISRGSTQPVNDRSSHGGQDSSNAAKNISESPTQDGCVVPPNRHDWYSTHDDPKGQESGTKPNEQSAKVKSEEPDDGRLQGNLSSSSIQSPIDEGPDYVGMARRARRFSTVLPGLGHIYFGKLTTGILHVLVALILLTLIIGSVTLIEHDGTIALNVHLHSVSKLVLEVSAKHRVEPFINRNRKILFPVVLLGSLFLYLALWAKSKSLVYQLIIKNALGCKIIHCREDGTIKISAGTKKGVEKGTQYTIMKGLKNREMNTLDTKGTEIKHKSYIPIGTATVVKIRNNTSVATVELYRDASSSIKEGDKLIPL